MVDRAWMPGELSIDMLGGGDEEEAPEELDCRLEAPRLR